MNVPKVFSSSSQLDPAKWIEEFRLMAKLNKWANDDWIDFIKLYLGSNEKIWYKKNKSLFTSWEVFVNLFVQKFANVKTKSQIWEKLRTINQADFSTIEELELELQELLDGATIKESSLRTDWLLSTLSIESKKIVEEESLKEWSEIVSRLVIEENSAKVKIKKKNTDSDNSHKEYVRNAASKSGKNVKELVKDQKPYNQFLKMFGDLSVNLINKVDEVVEKRLKEVESSRQRYLGPRKIICYNCQKEGHARYECPLLKKNEAETKKPVEAEKVINFIQLAEEMDNDIGEICAVEKRKGIPEVEIEVPRKVGRPRLDDTAQNVRVRTTNANSETTTSNLKTVSGTISTDLVKPFSLVSELEKLTVKVNVLQLLDSSTTLSKELLDYINKNKTAELNELEVEEKRLSNCKALVKIFGLSIWAIIDTGASCSVVSPGLVEEWGLSPDNYEKQVIVTADGKRHPTLGKISQVPLKISSFTFPVSLWIMERNENVLILDT
ncbi:hypothetical protein AX774_g4628 [Zancudomyces culisetae]|uniref:CCHC-type domain-containing protein n=1 Tax=Zancudomyces culisetae TaxID=1213189 RepID=A0A1R1PLV0_ZANCU|nr:hypothetical protein AX774_g4628 [Zancudomyces culisetae]|eukprot:OMH81909.1 hypothetical protein AX774_g4628 [Zancudomyces culisetae]